MKWIFIILLLVSCNVLKTLTDGETDLNDDFYESHSCDTSGNSTDGDSCNDNNDNTQYSLWDDLVSFWRFEETGASNDRMDVKTLNNFSYTGSGSLLASSGKVGNSIDCSNFGAVYLNNSSSSSIDFLGTQDFSISIWVKNHTNTLGFFFEKEGDIQLHNWDSGSGFHRDVNLWLFGGSLTLNTTHQPLTFSDWHHVVVNVDRDLGATIIVNGDFSNAAFAPYISTGDTMTANSAIHPCYFESAGPSSILNGELDSMGVWNRLLTAEEISALYNGNNDLD